MLFMKDIIKQYLEWKGTYAPRASINYKLWLLRFVQVSGEKKLEDYTVGDVIKFRHWMELKYNPGSHNYAVIILKNFLQYCKTQNLHSLSPTLIKLPRINPKSHRAITEEEANKIISEIPENEFHHLRDNIIVRMLWDTGMRVSELCSMDISQVSDSKRTAIIQTKKTGRKRIVVWSIETHRLLMKYMPIRTELHNTNKAIALFIGWANKSGWTIRITPRSVQRMVKYYALKVGIKEKVTPHSFRHGWAHKRRDLNAPLSFIQKGLGHNHPISTFIYEQYNDVEFEKNAINYLRIA